MTNSPFVLIASTLVDVATDEVVKRLTAKSIPHKRINTEDFPFSKTLAFQYGDEGRAAWLAIENETIPRPSAVWYRRLRSPAKPPEMDSGVYEFCLQENRAALIGGLMGCNSRWMSSPGAIWQAEHKLYQIHVSKKVGLRSPRTVVTNNPDAIRDAYHLFGRMIAKPTKSGFVSYQGQDFSIYTSQLLEEHLDSIESARWSPSIYQELIPKRFDIRVTIVGTRIFAAAIDSQSDPIAQIDWRRTANANLPHYPVELPDSLSERLLAMMNILGLSFAAIDLVQTPEDEFVFLEVNPNGQWMWIDDLLNLGISDAIANWLAGSPLQC